MIGSLKPIWGWSVGGEGKPHGTDHGTPGPQCGAAYLAVKWNLLLSKLALISLPESLPPPRSSYLLVVRWVREVEREEKETPT